MKNKYIVVGTTVLFLVCGISLASKNRRKMPRSSEEGGEPPDNTAAQEKEAYMRQLQHEIEMRQQNPFLCLPKYLCIVQGESGQKKTAVLSSLRPIPHAILKQQQNSGPFPFPVQRPRPSLTPTSDETKEKDNGSYSVEDEEALDYSESTEDFGLSRDDVLHALTVDRLEKNGSDTGVMGKLKTMLMPSFKMPSLIPISMPGFPSFFKGSEKKNANNEESHSTVKPPKISGNLLKPGQLLKRRTSFFSRTKRQAEESEEIPQSQERNDTGFRTPEQCQLLFSGCELSYDEIMKISNSGAVVVENDSPVRPPPPVDSSEEDPGYARPPPRRKPIKIEDDELDHFLREEAHKRLAAIRRTTQRPNSIKYYSNYHPNRPHISIPNTLLVHELRPNQAAQLLYPKGSKGNRNPSKIKLQQLQHAQEFLTQDSKYGSTTSFYNKNKPPKHVKPLQYDEDDVETRNPSVGLPILPVRLQWGRPVKIGDKYVRPFQKQTFQHAAPAPFYTTTTEPPPIFSKTPVDMKIPSNIPIFANRTHQAILKAKPYHPQHITRTKQLDKFGRPVSYASVFTEIAGSSGGVHDYFDKIASTIGENIIKTEQDLLNSNKRRVSRRKKNRVKPQTPTAKPLDSDEDKDDTTKEEDDPEDTTKEDETDTEKSKDKEDEDIEEEEEDADEEDDADNTDFEDDHKKKNKYEEEKEILAILPSFMQEAIQNDRIRRKNKRKKKKKKNSKDNAARTDRRRGEPMEEIEYMPIPLNRPSKVPSRGGLFSSIYNMMRPKRTNKWSS